MSNLLYRSSLANQPSLPSTKTRKAMLRRINLHVYLGLYNRDEAVMATHIVTAGHATKRDVYGYHPTKG